MAAQAASLLTLSGDDRDIRFFVHRWTATELAARAPGPELAGAHQHAAAYWRWRVEIWPQNRAADVHDLLEARHHLLQAGDTESAGEVTELACSQLHTWGAWDQEAALVHDTLARLSTDSARQAVWIHQLGMIAQDRGEYDEAARQYQRALDINEQLGNQVGLAGGYHQLGVLAHTRGDYEEAARQYHRSLDIEERLGDQVGQARTYSQLGILETDRGGSTAIAIAWLVKALLIRAQLGVPEARFDLRRLSVLRRELGVGPFTSLLAEVVGNPEAAEAITSWLDQWDNSDDSTD